MKIYNNFRFQVTGRILLLVITTVGALLLWFKTPYFLSAVLISLLVIYQISRLIHFVEKTNRKLRRFLDSIRHSDFSRSFSSSNLGSTFEKLDESFQEVVDVFEEQRIEKHVQFRYMQTLVQHVGIGLISFNQEGETELLNAAAKQLLDVAALHNIEGLKKVDPALFEGIKNIKRGTRDVIHISINDKPLQLAVHETVFRLREKKYKLVSLQDINAELEEKQMEAWQKLTQVLAHEIMNSVTPIASLSETVNMLLEENIYKNDNRYVINEEAVSDVSEALDTIETRSEGLIRFVDSYRDITQIPQPEVERFSLEKMLYRVKNLNSSEAKERHITFQISVEPDSLELAADPHLIEQVLINLIKNAFRALEDQPEGTIILHAEMASRGSLRIEVTDNGPGISQEMMNKIFIPFYSTQRPHKQGGSGIGLSLSQQIMRAQGGSLDVQSEVGTGTTFTLRF